MKKLHNNNNNNNNNNTEVLITHTSELNVLHMN